MILDDEVEICLSPTNINYFIKKGYEIPKIINKKGKFVIKKGTKIIVKVRDLMKSSSCRVNVECDCCKKHFSIIYENYTKTNRNGKIYCRSCAKKLFNSGENHPLYKSDITDEERSIKRSYPGYTDFIKRVLARDDYICQCCGKNKQDAELQVHHIDSYNWCKDKRTDETNGITLCKICHSNFHAMYGNGNNTREQFEEWIGKTVSELKKYDGEISSARKIYCYEEDKIYNSAYEYVRFHNLKYTSPLYNVCNGIKKYKTVNGNHLFWYDEYINMSIKEVKNKILAKPIRSNKKSVICIDTGIIYESIIEASKKTNIHHNSISNCCNHRQDYVINKDGKKIKMMFYDEYKNLMN